MEYLDEILYGVIGAVIFIVGYVVGARAQRKIMMSQVKDALNTAYSQGFQAGILELRNALNTDTSGDEDA
jgi:hypothetical protein